MFWAFLVNFEFMARDDHKRHRLREEHKEGSQKVTRDHSSGGIGKRDKGGNSREEMERNAGGTGGTRRGPSRRNGSDH